MNITITGATGFVGKSLVKRLLSEGHEIKVLSRNASRASLSLPRSCHILPWKNPLEELPPKEAFLNCDAVINLAGEPIAQKKWNDEQKRKIFDSRIQSTRNLVAALKELIVKPKTFLSVSGVGFYGDSESEILREDAPMGEGFLPNTCYWWEKEAQKASELGIRTSIVRTGIVIGRGGGALSKLLLLFQKGLGGVLSSGNQWMSWICLQDLVRLFLYLLENEKLVGIFNGVAPHPVTNLEFTKTLGHLLHRPTLFWLPKPILNTMFGEMSCLFLDSARVSSKKIEAKGFHFEHPTLKNALESILK